MTKKPNNLELWDQVKDPDPEFTKGFKRGGGFSGTATNATYLVQRATEIFGINGVGWGVEVTDEKYVEGAPLLNTNGDVIGYEKCHVVRGHVWFMHEGKRYQTGEQFGQTMFVGKNKYGPFTDEEAPKKSITDMQSKCLSLLGFAASIHLGMWDDNKYVNEVKKKASAEKAKAQEKEMPEDLKNSVDDLIENLRIAAEEQNLELLTKLKDTARNIYADVKAYSAIKANLITAEVGKADAAFKTTEGTDNG